MLNSKERSFLKKLANSEVAIIQIGKSSHSPEVVKAIDEALEKRELIKVTVLENCMDGIKEVAEVVSERTHSDVVQIVGKKIVFYRESKVKENRTIDLAKLRRI